MISEMELIDADYDDLSDSDIVVLLLMNGSGAPISKTRLQYLACLYRELYKRPGASPARV